MECITCKHEMNHLEKDLFICDGCGLVSSNIYPDPSIYDRSYEIKYDRYERTPTGQEIQKIRRQCLTRHVALNNGRVRLLDFGCGVGSFIKSITDAGVETAGFDINPYTQYCDVAALFGKYEVVTFWDSLEHIRSPQTIIKALDPLYLFVCTPSTDDLQIVERSATDASPETLCGFTHWRHYMPVEHCHYFNDKSLTALVKKCGYEILEVNYNESKPRAGGGDRNILTIAAKRTGHGTN